MNLNLHLGQRLEQRQILAPRMIQSMEILQLPIMALEERLQQELVDNPALELREPSADDFVDPAAEGDDGPNPDGVLVIKDDAADDFNRLDNFEHHLGEPLSEDHRPSRSFLEEASDRKQDVMASAPSRPQSLQEYLEEQLAYLEVPERELQILRYVIAHIDARGYLDSRGPEGSDPLQELARNFPEGTVDRDEIEDALTTIQKLDPPGVGARDLKECLLLQLTPEVPHRDVVRTLILNHMPDVEHNRLPVIQKRTGLPIQTIQEAIAALRQLNPKPGSAFSSENIPYVTPDVIVERTESGDYEVRLVDDWLPDVHVPRSVIEMARNRDNDPEARKYIRNKIQAATWILDAVRQRKYTLERVTREIVRRQKAFLDLGPDHIEPLKMQDIADAIGIHVTTVSRAVDDKWVETPRGIFPLKRFFGGGTQSATGENIARETIKNKLIEMINSEDKSDPLSDDAIEAMFEAQGLQVKRRTVTKYRKMLAIPSSRERRDWSLPRKHADSPLPEEPDTQPTTPDEPTDES
ncbi:MAG: RNA polymerase factor sigma-54 [Gemmataceae bacterium]|nr:RNA polymerase factor sigma-54 [Gemmataceae bacterium]